MSGELQPFKSGAAYLAATLQIPTVPANVAGTRESCPKGQTVPLRRQAR